MKNKFKRVKEHGYIIIINGHTMFPEDIISKLERLDFVEEKKIIIEAQNKEMLEALIENLKESINLEVNRGTLLKTAMIHNSHEIDIIEKHTGKTIDEVLK